ncbi:hypothetical protein WICMUC_003800 [Wickerhamomyces mucosus]|uniref:CAP-Gly domain-containing protein n=1 Tax=Wickerhamomyces mucosus TaxID=1378264 RepID=A0A9P8PKU9_9ASCO|nr:hypothetical protein WICMUC_003800 [Wickerhamomyces mucosus]
MNMSDITVHFTSQLTNSERRISPNWSFEYLKQRIENFTGIPPNSQQLLLFPTSISTDPVDLSSNDDSTAVLDLNITSDSRVQINDTRPLSEQEDLTNESDIKYFELDEKDYEKRSDTVRRWKQDNQLGRFHPDFKTKKKEQLQNNKVRAQQLCVGARFRTINEIGERRGVIKYIGKVLEIDFENIWTGVEFDEPVGKNDGSIKGVRYFSCKPGYGGFLKPVQVEQGDFQEESLFSDDDEI